MVVRTPIIKGKYNLTGFFKNKNAQYFITLVILLWIVIFGSTTTSISRYYSLNVLVGCIISTTIVSVVISSILVALPRRFYSIYPTLFTIFTILLYVNSIFSRFFGRVIPKSIYSQASNLTTMDSNAVTSLLIWSDFISIATIIVAFILLPRIARKIKYRPKFMIPLLLSTLILPTLYWQAIDIRQMHINKNETIVSNYNDTKLLTPDLLNIKYSLPFVIGVEFFTYNTPYPNISKSQYNLAKKHIASITEQNIREIETIAKNPHNLIVILVESLNSEALCMEAMPFTYHLSQDNTNIFIPNIEEAVGIGRSMDGQLLTLSGLCPNRNQFTFAFFEQEFNLPSIIKSLNTHTNYKSILSTITDTTFWSQHIAARAMGIEKLFGSEEYKSYKWIDDKMLFSNVIKNLEKLDKKTPLFYTILTGNSHAPFDPNVKPIYPLTSGLNKDIGYYYTALQSTDREISNLFSYLRDKDILDQTTIIIAADHSMSGIYSESHKPLIPLLIVNPLNNPKYRPKNNASQVSIFPTIMHAMGITDSTYMGLTPSMLSPRIDSLTESDFRKIEEVSMSIIYYNDSKNK